MACVFPFISLPDRKHLPGALSIIRGSDSLGQQLIDRWGVGGGIVYRRPLWKNQSGGSGVEERSLLLGYQEYSDLAYDY